MFIDIQKHVRKLSITWHFLSNTINIPIHRAINMETKGTCLRNASLFNPPDKPAPSITVFKNLVLQEIQRVQF